MRSSWMERSRRGCARAVSKMSIRQDAARERSLEALCRAGLEQAASE